MAPPLQPPQSATPSFLKKPLLKLFFTTILCSVSYFLGIDINYSSPSHSYSTQLKSHYLHCPPHNLSTHSQHYPFTVNSLNFEPHHSIPLLQEPSSRTHQIFPFCSSNFTNYCPCHDPSREKRFPVDKLFHRERHCPKPDEKLQCLVPRPVGYKKPFPWPKSIHYAWFDNVPFPKLTVYKKSQNWVRLEGDRLVFRGGGTSFPMGVKGYVDMIKQVVPLKSGSIRTALDVGCGVASFGAYLMDYNILTLSIAPRDIHEAQVQFALERGLPAMLGIFSIYRLPFSSRSFDMAHCSRCLVPWTRYDGLYLMEIDRVLRPGGYWILSGPPISWKISYKGWQRRAADLRKEQMSLEDLARRLCWKKVEEKGPIAVWRKPTNHIHCIQKVKTWKSPNFCHSSDSDSSWLKEMDPCITPLPNVEDVHDMSGGTLEKWPKRLNSPPPRIITGNIKGITVRAFNDDNQLWKRRVSHYGIILKSLLISGRYRNVMDMNAGLGGFAAALVKYPLWVMNVIPFDSNNNNTLGVIYERGLIGTYMNWCEAFSTYPRTYDLIHAHYLFSMYIDKCDIVDILLEMYRIRRPDGVVLIRDHVDIIVKVNGVIDRVKWKGKIFHSENGPLHPEKILLVDSSA